jgi:hypothetical protein
MEQNNMTKPLIGIVDCSIDPFNTVVREMNDEEYAKHLESLAKAQTESEAQQN